MARLSKGRVLEGAQCEKLLWLRAREPDAPELVPGPGTQALFDAGLEVGEHARGEFHDGVLVHVDRGDLGAAIAETRRLVARRDVPIFEASFVADGVFVAVDILEPSEAGWTIVEVKAGTRVRDHHILDLAIQVHVLRVAGVRVARADVMHLNRECRYPHLHDLFAREDVTERVEAEVRRVPELLEALSRVPDGPRPEVVPGPHCRTPYPCPFVDRCRGSLPEFPVQELYRLHRTKRTRLARCGVQSIVEIPRSFELTETQARQRRAIMENRLVVEPGLEKALEHGLEGPGSFLDFETVMLPIPRWPGCRPWDQVPVQFSVHREGSDGGLEHVGYLADGGDDPRPALARALVDAVPREGAVWVYFEPFEKGRLRELAEAVPELRDELLGIEARIVDLLQIVRRHIYHPRFKGSFSIKAVVPVLCPGAGWQGLKVASGDVAAAELRSLLRSSGLDDRERTERREVLLRYCERDTRSLAILLQTLRAMV